MSFAVLPAHNKSKLKFFLKLLTNHLSAETTTAPAAMNLLAHLAALNNNSPLLDETTQLPTFLVDVTKHECEDSLQI